MRTPVATSWWWASWATNRSAVVRTLKVIASTESSGGSKGTSASSSGGGVRAAKSARSSPRARRRTAAPCAPSRCSTASPGRSARSPRVRSPSRCSRLDQLAPARPSSCSTWTGQAAQERRRPAPGHDHPGLHLGGPGRLLGGEEVVGDARAGRPRRRPRPAPGTPSRRRWSRCRTSCRGRGRRAGRGAARPRRGAGPRRSPGPARRRGRRGRGWRAAAASSGHRDWASRRRCPRRTPSARAGPLQTSTTLARQHGGGGAAATAPPRRARRPPTSRGTTRPSPARGPHPARWSAGRRMSRTPVGAGLDPVDPGPEQVGALRRPRAAAYDDAGATLLQLPGARRAGRSSADSSTLSRASTRGQSPWTTSTAERVRSRESRIPAVALVDRGGRAQHHHAQHVDQRSGHLQPVLAGIGHQHGARRARCRARRRPRPRSRRTRRSRPTPRPGGAGGQRQRRATAESTA